VNGREGREGREGSPGSAPDHGPEQQRYARWLDRGTKLGLVVLVASFFVYAFGVWPARVPPEQVPQWWSLPVAAYLERSGAPTGWAWFTSLGQGDSAALLGIALLAACSVPSLLALVPIAWRAGRRRFAWLCITEAAVIVVAASGLAATVLGH
jgi:hypothetical protein